MNELKITPQPDVKIFLGRKPFPYPFTHLSVETDVEVTEHVTYIKGRVLRVYHRDLLLAATGDFAIDVKGRTARLRKKNTTLYSTASKT